MIFLQKIKQAQFWNNVLKVAIPFFIIVTFVSLVGKLYFQQIGLQFPKPILRMENGFHFG